MYNSNDGYENNGTEYYENDNYGYAADEQQEEDQELNTFENVPTEGMWQEYCTLAYNNRAVTSVEYDSNVELLWAGYDDGRVSSFSMKFDSSVEELEQPQRHSSFMACEESVLQLIPLQSCILSVSQSSIQMHSVGGLSLGKFCSCPSGLNDEGVETPFLLTCAVAFRPPGGLVTAESVGPTHLLAGTSSNFVYIYDINMPGGSPLLEYDVSCRTVCIRASDAQIAVAGVDGKVRLLDSSLRNQSVIHTFDAHSGPLSDLCLQPDGLTMLTCGVISRPINPYDPKSPINVRFQCFGYLSILN
jgi:WD40 repeat protein